MAKEDFIINAIKERIVEGLNLQMTHLENWMQMDQDNKNALMILSDETRMRDVIDLLLENARLECQMSGKIPGNKEILEIVTPIKARGYAIDYISR